MDFDKFGFDRRPFNRITGWVEIQTKPQSVEFIWHGGDMIGITDEFLTSVDDEYIHRDNDLVKFGNQFTVRLLEHFGNGIWLAKCILSA